MGYQKPSITVSLRAARSRRPASPQHRASRQRFAGTGRRLLLTAVAGLLLGSAGCTSLPRGGAAPANWGDTFKRWLGAWKQPAPKAASPAAPTVVTVNLTAIAMRHPAWQLAGALERSRSTVKTPSVSALVVTPLPAGAGIAGAATNRPAAPGGIDLPARQVVAQNSVVLLAEARALQAEAFAGFMNLTKNRQDAALASRKRALETALNDDVEAAERVLIPDLTPEALPPEVQLELSNLRLQILLIDNLPPDLKKNVDYQAKLAKAKNRLRELEARWVEELRQDVLERQVERKRLRVDEPQRIRKEGDVRNKKTIADAAQRYENAREKVATEYSQREDEDFARGFNPLRIELPPAHLASPGHGGAASEKTSEQKGGAPASTAVVPPTALPQPGATPGGAKPNGAPSVSPAGGRAAQIKALRQTALNDARRWARIAIHRAGWKWQEELPAAQRPATAPDRTEAILRILQYL